MTSHDNLDPPQDIESVAKANHNEDNKVNAVTEKQLPTISLKVDLPNADASEKDMRHDFEDILDIIGLGRTQWMVFITCGFLLMMVINETMGMSIITIASQCDFGTSSMDKAVMSAASFIGILCSSYFWGYLSDTSGRRTVLMYTTIAGNFVSFVSIFIANFWAFVFLRFVVGIFIAGASSTTYAYLGEFYMQRHRAFFTNWASMFVGFANIYVPAIAWLILTMHWSYEISESFIFRPWRLLNFFYLLPGILATVLLYLLPESPKLLLSLGKDEEAFRATEWICRFNTGQQLQDFKVYKLKRDPRVVEINKDRDNSKSCMATAKHIWNDTRPLFKRPHVLNFVVCCVVMCGLFVSHAGMGLWYPDIQNRVGSISAEPMTVCQVIDASMQEKADSESLICDDTISTKSFMDSIIFGLSYTFGYVVVGLSITHIGRKRLIIAFLFLAGCCGVAMNWILNPIGIVVIFCLFLILPGLCISVLSGAVVDLVPTHLRGKAVCICLMIGRSGSVIGSNLNGIMLESFCTLTFGLFSGVGFVCAALVFILPI